MMKSFSARSLVFAAVVFVSPAIVTAQTPIADAYRPAANRLIAAALADSSAWNKLAELTDKFGPRLSGSASLESEID